MIRMSKKARERAKSLAVCYAAWTEADIGPDASAEELRGAAFWAGQLNEVQVEMGIEIAPDLPAVIRSIKERIADLDNA